MGGVSPKDARLRVTWWHASLFSQIFSLMIFLALGVWYIVVASAPGYISEYLPAESSADATTILGDFVIVMIWIVLVFFTWKQRKPAFLASVAASLFLLVLVSISFLYAKSMLSAPDFSDFIWYPDSVMIIIFGVMAYRSFSRKT